MKFKECPRCHNHTLYLKDTELNALSRRDNKTYICSSCGGQEALIDDGIITANTIEKLFVQNISRKFQNQGDPKNEL